MRLYKPFLSFQLFHAGERLQVLVLKASELELISSKRLDDRKDIQSVESTWLILRSELKACAIPPLERNNKRRKMNTHTHAPLQTHDVVLTSIGRRIDVETASCVYGEEIERKYCYIHKKDRLLHFSLLLLLLLFLFGYFAAELCVT